MSDQDLYFIALVPEEPVLGKVMELKELIADNFNSKGALKSPPHITLHMPFKWRADRTSQLLDRLSQFKFDSGGFDVCLKDFAYFEPRVVFVDVVENVLLRELYHQLSKFIRRELKLLNADYKSRGFHPHMTIGFRDLRKTAFYQAKELFDQKTFEEHFKVAGFWLLKHDGEKWTQYKFFGF